ncbi:hypothetical protein B0H17DRAFT_217457 [Mycena rosella]|uniref:C3H1-type domain-containing protein n=1 Tax=Mycena rosella TaxID=1033263 RepID=A0AAD7G865_MYCRO|nr:hypothetical protein B0H17DRAFT_217457 [Mycena rosella]
MTTKPARRSRTTLGSSSNPTAQAMDLPAAKSDVPDKSVVNSPKITHTVKGVKTPTPISKVSTDDLRTKATINETCRRFLRNRCPQGERCPYIHVRPPAEGQLINFRAETAAPISKVSTDDLRTKAIVNETCRLFLGNQCHRGERCPYIHVRPPAEGQPTQPKVGLPVEHLLPGFNRQW